MIIELFGPPGVGKTTLAYALASRLRERGRVVELVLSPRPSEYAPSLGPSVKDSARQQAPAAVRRLARPVAKMFAIARHLSANPHEVSTATGLIKMLPPKNIVWSFRLLQYTLRLSCSWHQASLVNHIVLFDQGYVQAVISLALLGRARNRNRITLALDCVPKSDLLVRLDAPQEILEARLGERKRLQSRMEQLFELDLKTSLRSVQIIEHLHDLLQKRGQSVICVNSTDQRSLCEAVKRIEAEVMARFSA